MPDGIARPVRVSARVTPAPSIPSYAVEEAVGGLAGRGLAAAGAGGDAVGRPERLPPRPSVPGPPAPSRSSSGRTTSQYGNGAA